MEHNIDNRDFERFVKQNADQYRMFPSEKVWEEIHTTLHTRRRRWLLLGFALLLLTTATVTGIMFLQHKRQSDGYSVLANLHSSNRVADASRKYQQPIALANGPVQAATNNNPFITTEEGIQQHLVNPSQPAALTPEAEQAITALSAPVISLATPATLAAPSVNAVNTSVNTDFVHPDATKKAAAPGKNNQTDIAGIPATTAPAGKTVTDIPVNNTAPETAVANPRKKDDSSNELAQPRIPSREIIAPVRVSAKNKAEWHLYMTPTVSYRTLTENMEYLSAARYNSIVNGTGTVSYPSDVNTMVDHRPDIGFQLGLRSSLPVSKFLRFTAGLQFSVSKYDIKAYQHPAEMTTIALSDRSISTVSSFRNTNGTKENWLRNFYFSASVPVGLELKLSDGTKNYFGIAGTLQPTYVLDNRAWLISSDYKNYAEMPSLTRRWNMNTSFEIFAAQRTGKLNWRVGPQVRYQMMSSFTKNYPIKEHLFDFGLKLGIQLQ